MKNVIGKIPNVDNVEADWWTTVIFLLKSCLQEPGNLQNHNFPTVHQVRGPRGWLQTTCIVCLLQSVQYLWKTMPWRLFKRETHLQSDSLWSLLKRDLILDVSELRHSRTGQMNQAKLFSTLSLPQRPCYIIQDLFWHDAAQVRNWDLWLYAPAICRFAAGSDLICVSWSQSNNFQ